MQCTLVKSDEFDNSYSLLYILLKPCLCCCSLATLAPQQLVCCLVRSLQAHSLWQQLETLEVTEIFFVVFSLGQLWLDKAGKSENTVKTLRLGFSELKMQAVSTRKNKGISRAYDRKFTKSYITSRDGITCRDKYRRQSHCEC